MKKINSNLRDLFLVAIFSLIYFQFIETPRYTSQMIIAIKQDEQNNESNLKLNFGIGQNGFQSSGTELFKIKEFFESEKIIDTKNILIKNLDTNNIYDSNFLDISNWISKKNKIKKYQKVVVKNESNTVSFFSTSFSAKGSQLINLINLAVLSDHYDKTQKLNSEFKIARKICELDIEDFNFDEDVSDRKEINIGKIKDFTSGIDLLSAKLEDAKKLCLENISNEKNVDFDNSDLNIPRFNMNNLLVRSVNSSTDDIVGALIERNFVSDKIEIVSDISSPDSRDNNNVVLKTILIIFLFSVLKFAWKILARVIEEG